VLAVTIGLALGFIITLFVSKDPVGAYKSFLLGPISRLNRIGDWLEESLTLILLGLVICIVFGASQWYIGVEGQMVLGAMAAGCVALYVPIPPLPRILLAFLAAMIVGALWGLIPALLKAYYNANELVTSLMMNTVALKIFEYILKAFIMTPKSRSISSELIEKPFRLPTFIPNLPFLQGIREIWMKQTSVTIMVYIVIAAVIIVYYLLYKTPFGYELRTVGLNPKFARYGGINVNRTIIMSIMVSGIFAGLAGVHLSLAIHNKIISNMTSGLGFEGINIAILAGNNPLGVPIAGLLYGYLRAGSDVMERSSDVSI
jgi:simple sugar transport system permease protein